MAALYIVLLIAIGLVLLILEILILPGFIAGVIGGIFITAGVLATYAEYGSVTGHMVALASVLLSIGLIVYFLRSKSWKKFGLKTQLEGRTNEVDKLPIKEGDTGITVSALRPMGTVLIHNQRVEAQTNGEMLAERKKVRVISVLPNKVIVEPV
ncbi:MAG: hypothetical protein LC117_11380 [Bacteroidia bacterium]|nr:NfeD family protein [Bacteroidia bacterium]MCZ2278515.1 hypothetical protein [Bacteroidia bacterium]